MSYTAFSETAWEYSPINYIQDIIKFNQQRKLRFIVGENESFEFQRNSREMANVSLNEIFLPTLICTLCKM